MGGAATSAQTYDIRGIAIDGSGNIYLADSYNNVIRKVTVSTGVISTVAGNGYGAGLGYGGFTGDGAAATSARLSLPSGVTVDGSGNIYICDTQNHRIRKVTTSTGNINTIAGTGTAGFSGDGSAATSAKLNYPDDITIDASGNLYILDSQNYRIRKITASTGNISTVAGNGSYGYSGDGGAATSASFAAAYSQIALDASGNIFIADNPNHRIRMVTVSTGNISTIVGSSAGFSGDGGAASSAQLNQPYGVAIKGSGDSRILYIGDNNNHRIRAVGTACTANAGTNKTNYYRTDCPPPLCTSVQIGTSGSSTYNWLPCNGTLSSCTVAQPNASPCSGTT